MRPVYLLAFLFLLAVLPASAQQHKFPFPDIRCDSTVCRTYMLPNETASPQELVSIRMLRDSVNFTVTPAQTLPAVIPASGSYPIGLCFTPNRRGSAVDSMQLLVRRQTGEIDTINVRLSGNGFGPDARAVTTVLNFPKTNVGGSSSMRVKLFNRGETRFPLTAAAISAIAPFRVVTPLPVDILPGDTIEIEIAFEPTEPGVFPLRMNIQSGCSGQIQISLNGITDFEGTGAVLQVTKLGFDPINQEESTCEAIACREITLTNAGNALLTIDTMFWKQGNLGYSITPLPTFPLQIEPNSEQVYSVCLDGRNRGLLEDTLSITSNTRASIAFGVVIDQSNSMREPMENCTGVPERMNQARTQARDFVGRTLLHLPAVGIQDNLAVISYGDTNRVSKFFPLTPITDADRLVAQQRIDTLKAWGGNTATGEAMDLMFKELDGQPLKNRIIVLLSDGAATDTVKHPVSSIIATAREKGIKVFTIAIALQGAGRVYLDRIARETGGIFFDGSDCNSLRQAFQSITEIVGRGTIHLEPFAMRVTAPLLINSGNVDYDTIRLGDSSCRTITLTNVGEGDAIIERADIFDLAGAAEDEFYVDPSVDFPVEIPANGQETITICFKPKNVRTRDGVIRFRYNNCAGTDTLQALLHGSSISDVNLRLTDRRVGVPGDIVTLPIYSDSSLTRFDIHNATFTLRWNRTMLVLGALRAGSGAPGASVQLVGPVTYDGRYALANIEVTGERFVGGGEIALVDFRIMRGDTLATTVELVAGQFEDNNPTLVLVNVASVELDSSCFRDSGPVILQTAAARVVAGEITPTPSNSGIVSIVLQSTEATMVSVEIYSTDGERHTVITALPVEQGSNRITLDLGDIGPGAYHALFRTAAGESFVRALVLTQ